MDRSNAEKRIVRIAESSDGIVSVYLFGSVAEGRSHAESDLDVGFLLDWNCYLDERARFDARIRLSSQISTTTVMADVVILNDAPPELARRIVTQGIRLFCSSPQLDHDFRRDVQLKAADLEPFLRRMRQIKLDALAKR